MAQKAKVYMPIKKKEEYLPFFRYEEDEEMEGFAYLLKDVKIKLDSPLAKKAIEGIEGEYNYFDSNGREMLELEGLKFEYVLNPDQSCIYKLRIDDVAKEYISKAVLNITIIDGEFQEMVLAISSGICYGHISYIDSLDEESKEFINMLLAKKLLKVKNITVSMEKIEVN